MTGIYRFLLEGNLCAVITDEVSTGVTFADDANLLKALFNAQCIMYVPLIICFTAGIGVGKD